MNLRETLEWWGSTPAERASAFACDPLLRDPELVLFRAIDVAAPAAVTYRWLCQLRAGPYVQDLVNNFGKPSPKTLVPGLEHPELGARYQTFFRLTGFEPGRSLTMSTRGPIFGTAVFTYRADPAGPDRSRIVVKIRMRYPTAPVWSTIARRVLLPADLMMVRRQLITLRDLAEETARTG